MTKPVDGINIIKQRLKTAPVTPGVYRMVNEKGDVLYVGKAKNLKSRLTSYTQGEQLSTRIRRMVFETRELLLVETGSEAEALLLEANLIKSLKPKYNIIFRDDASYPAILITNEATPWMRYHRGAQKTKGSYFGPYPNAGAVHRTLDMMERAFRLRTCKPSVFKNRTRPCLKYDIKRCSGPCTGKITPEDYAELVREAKLFLKGQGNKVQKIIQQRMQDASENWRFEDAAVERDRLQALASVTSQRSALTHALNDADVFAFVLRGGKACVQGFFYRNGAHVGNQTFFPKGGDDMDVKVFARSFLALYYAERKPPHEILCSHLPEDVTALGEALSQSAGHKVALSNPKRGERRQIIKQALSNADNNLNRKTAEGKSWQQQMQSFGELLGLEMPPVRVECFDVSNISGKQAVASMVVAGGDGMLKSDYRKFSIKNKDTPDDYAMMHEVLTRRYKRLLKENDAEGSQVPWPDIIMVDGGVGHLNVLVRVAEELGLDGDMAPTLTAIAKGEQRDAGLEKIYVWQQQKVVQVDVPHHTPLIFLLQRIRDEAHRFAIGFHRQQRSKGVEKSLLDQIPGIGPKRKKALLLHFGSAAEVQAASVNDLGRVEGVSSQLAQHIYDWLHSS